MGTNLNNNDYTRLELDLLQVNNDIVISRDIQILSKFLSIYVYILCLGVRGGGFFYFFVKNVETINKMIL